MPLLHFHRELSSDDEKESARDLGIALVDRVERFDPSVRRHLGRTALVRLESAVRNDPMDVPALDAEAHALWAIGDATIAAAAFEKVLTLAPRREATLQWAAALALERKRLPDAVAY